MREVKNRKYEHHDKYYIPQEAIDEYRKWPIEQRLKWLYMGNLLCMGYARKTIEVQDRFRKGKN